MHANHEALSSYDEGNVLHDGCDTCEERAAAGLDGILSLDDTNRIQLWRDMRAVEWSGGDGLSRNVSAADARAMRTLYTLAVFLERCGIKPDEIEERMVAERERLVAELGF